MTENLSPSSVHAAYGAGDLAELSVFAGGFINFGYWAGLPADGPPTLDHRIASGIALYDLVLDEISPGDRVVEVGCGRGLGARRALTRAPSSVVGVDVTPEQVERARSAGTDPRLEFVVGSADDLPLSDDSSDLLISVEAAQHFADLSAFFREAARVLVPGGRLVLTTFFAADDDAGPKLSALLETFASGLDRAHPISRVPDQLAAAGFVDVRIRSIGEHVWRGLDRWIAQGERRDSWDRDWLRAADRGLLDYHLLTARLPAGSGS
ncbi:methyltransferase domain-containing protein [Saccharothrix violaceirubra]|uniref:Cyclopropane fatty-acyl-phospholipid synthase-like methyltransferase n=1 Tax=Saccharothrix violaceirubra TaxID=413306 RepID=A0A7W7TBZ3_9PSEU|nr:class I SAM-dependent methyltransferase [Saccharothrix violaceirubra]MBB4968985.1 cyclopropane fatty-acyl-phospholipid synthase-like methyltransferase [Saccharothrix violaceirubra]